MDNDVLIKNGTVMDGTGEPAFRADVIVRNDRIEDVGLFPDAEAETVIDVDGLAVAPGFIDVHTHLDFLFPSPRHAEVMEKWARQGVTTIVAGCCGFSPAPINESSKNEISTYWNFALPHDGLDFEWSSMGEYLDHLERVGQAFNVAILTGHNTLRTGVMGAQARFARPDEISRMKKMLKQSLEDGSIGLSVGLYYSPGVFSHTDEVTELSSALTEYNAPIAAHTRGLTQIYDKAVEEIIEVAEKNKIPLQISHHAGGDPTKKKMVGGYDYKLKAMLLLVRLVGKKYFLKYVSEKNAARVNAVKAINEATERGVEIGHDNMPWACGPTTVLALLPPWLFDGGVDKALERLGEPGIRKRAAYEIKTLIPKWPPWENDWWTDNFMSLSALLTGFRLEKNKRFENMSLKNIAKEMRKDPFETIFDLIIEERGKFFIIDGLFDDPIGDEYIAYLLSDPNCSIMTDIVGADYSAPNPVPYGAFTKVLGYFARDRGVMTQEEAVRRMTSLPAKQMRLKNRGLIEKGAYADITIFNPQTVKNRASFKNPHQYSEGIEYVLINGKVVLEKGKYHSGALAGKVLRRS